ncbi:MAG: cytochrome c3 family protein [Gammaproteobacteria bacterium]|nr:cytochrome c3 family protein [Gammaproteobacteria bacterium]
MPSRSNQLRILALLYLCAWPVLSNAHETCKSCHRENQPTEDRAELVHTLPNLCIECHSERADKGEHQINIVPTGGTGPLPLVEGKLSCTTCHDPHSTQGKQLRISAKTLCLTCHQY